MRVHTAEQSRRLDRWAEETAGIPSLVLMENAALSVVEVVTDRFPECERIDVLCGPGNNGGDGLAVARHLRSRGYDVAVALLVDRDGLRPDAARQLAMLEGVTVEGELPILELLDEAAVEGWLRRSRDRDLWIDALFGTGLGRPLEGRFARLVEGLAEAGGPGLAIDLPSGLDADRPEWIGPSAPAAVTVTFEAPKLAHVLPPACRQVGEVVVASLGLPPGLDLGEGSRIELVTRSLARSLRLPRSEEGHKGTFGHLLVVAGGPGTTGAAILAARAAVRSGAGRVTVATPAAGAAAVELGSVESMTWPLEDPPGETLRAVADRAGEFEALAVGPGLGTEPEVVAAVRDLVSSWPGALVLDADGINAFAGRAESLLDRPAETVLTPHPGELARLLDGAVPETSSERIAAVRQAAERTGATVLLKGYRTLVATPRDELAILPVGNDGLATGGAGDVLTGVIGALLAADARPWDAARLAAYLHGLAADQLVETMAPESLRAGDLVEGLSAAFRALEAS